MGSPYGVVGPACQQGNRKISTHDFTHRTHMEIFNKEYYPPELTDWWMDDWISRVYGSTRSKKLAAVEVWHHTKTHGQRYNVSGNGLILPTLIKRGRGKIVAYMEKMGMPSHNITGKEFTDS